MGFCETTRRFYDDGGNWMDTVTKIEPWTPSGAPPLNRQAESAARDNCSPVEPKANGPSDILPELLARIGVDAAEPLSQYWPELVIDAACNQLWLKKHGKLANKADKLASFRHQVNKGYRTPTRTAEILRDITREKDSPADVTARPERRLATAEEKAKFQRDIAAFLDRRGKSPGHREGQKHATASAETVSGKKGGR
jgi:hypothetical protein